MGFNKLVSTLLGMIFFLFISPELMAQTENTSNKISLGFEGGVQFTKIYDNWAVSALPKSKVGFNLGFFADYKFDPRVKVRLGLQYDNRGFIIQDGGSPITDPISDFKSYNSYFIVDLDYTLNYLTIPFSVFYEKSSDKFSIYLQAGFYYSLLLNAQRTGLTDLYIFPEDAEKFEYERYKTPGHNIVEYNKEDVFDLFVGNDWGIQFFFGVVYHINEKLDVQLTPGFVKSFEKLYADPSRNSNWSSIYKINAGIIYSLN